MVRGRTTAPAGLILGHGITAEVIETRPGIEFIKKGHLVSVPFNIACGRCRVCRRATRRLPRSTSLATAPSRTGTSTPRNALYLWAVEHLFRDNELIRGELRVGGERVDPGASRCRSTCSPVRRTGSRRPPTSSRLPTRSRLTQPTSCDERPAAAGLALFMGREALREHWPPILAGVLEHSQP